MAKGKVAEDKVLARRLMVLERVCGEKDGVSVSELATEYGVTGVTIENDVKDLGNKLRIVEIKNKKVYALPTTLEEMWSGTPIGERLTPSQSKIKLARATLSFLEQREDRIGRLILGTGTTVHTCACALISAKNFKNKRIHTANLLVIHEFIWHKPTNLFIESPGGALNLDTGALWSEESENYFKNIDAQAAVASFSDMSFKKGFCTIHQDEKEKLANLKPNPQTCKWVIIPMEWRKIVSGVHKPVANSRDEQLDFAGGRRKYIIITDKPSESEWNKDVDDPKLEDLLKWQEAYPDGVEIIYA
jgi:DeoR/GlpR family transcriptional regulator of sugar metabolism